MGVEGLGDALIERIRGREIDTPDHAEGDEHRALSAGTGGDESMKLLGGQLVQQCGGRRRRGAGRHGDHHGLP
jgi:hypothetical protein